MPRSRLLIEWLVGTIALAALAVALSLPERNPESIGTRRLDALGFDSLLRLSRIDPAPPLLIIEIDDASLGQIGHWPWPRPVHAALLERLETAGVAAIGYDVQWIEYDVNDYVLREQLQRLKVAGVPVVLPVSATADAEGRPGPLYPLPEFGLRTLLGHVHFHLDDDGVVRGLHLEEAGFAAFSLLLAASAAERSGGSGAASAVSPAGDATAGMPAVARAALNEATAQRRDRMVAAGQWPRERFVLLPQLAGPLERVSFGAVLRGEIDPARLRGRTVLIGATASGLGDRYANTVVGDGALSSGVELHAAAWSALRRDRLIQLVPTPWQVGLPAVIVLALMAGLYRLRPQGALVATLSTVALTMAAAALALRLGLWWSPAGTVIACLLAYPLWSWRRLEVATRGLTRESDALSAEPLLLPPGHLDRTSVEPVARSVQQLQAAAARSVTLRRFLYMTLQRLPHPAFVTDDNGWLVFANDRVKAVFGAEPEPGVPLEHWLAERAGIDLHRLASDGGHAPQRPAWPSAAMTGPPTGGPNASGPPTSGPSAQIRPTQPATAAPLRPDTVRAELTDGSGRSWLVDSAHFNDPDWTHATLWQLVDISPIRAAQREREQTLSFLSHDLRAPQASILAIIDQMQAAGGEQPPWLAEIRRQAQRSLELADNFVQLARAEVKTLERLPVDLVSLATEAADGIWRMARARSIVVQVADPGEAVEVIGDAQLLRRALSNLLDNAIKFSPEGSRVVITPTVGPDDADGCWCSVAVADEGIGLSDDAIGHVFEPYWRGNQGADRPGTGLGLTFVKLVAERHGGTVRAQRREPRGTVFELRLPRPPMELLGSE